MAKKDTPTITLERTYNIPLRKEFQKAPRWNRTKKAVKAAKQFLSRHMKTDIKKVKLQKSVNEELWKHGIKNPPHHVKVVAVKDSEGTVKAELFGVKKKEPQKEAKKVVKEGKKEEVKEIAPVVEEKKENKPKKGNKEAVSP